MNDIIDWINSRDICQNRVTNYHYAEHNNFMYVPK